MVTLLREFRQRIGRDVWHWREDCHWWPEDGKAAFRVLLATRRPKGDACNECLAKSKRNP